MPDHIIEAPDTTESEGNLSEQSNVEETQGGTKTEPTTAEASEAEGSAEGSQTAAEPEIEIGGRKVPVSKAEQALKDYENDIEWKNRNKRESEELNAQREKLKRAQVLDSMLESRPEILQQLFTPQQQRNFDTELAEHYSKRPDNFDPVATSAWELKRDQLVAEKGRVEIESRIESVRAREEARMHNERLEDAARQVYVTSKKMSDTDFERMTQWVIERRQFDPRNGKALPDAYDLAYRSLYSDRYERDIRASATQRTVTSLKNATSGGADAGLSQRTPPPSASEQDDKDFIGSIKEQSRGHYQKL